MIKIVTRENIECLLDSPEDYISYEQDTVLLKMCNETTVNNPILLMVGQCEPPEDSWYYLVLEDNDTILEDIRCPKEDLLIEYEQLVNRAQKILVST